MKSIMEEIARFQLGQLKYSELSPQAQNQLRHTWLVERVGFEPDMIFKASGVTHAGRQAVLKKAAKIKTGPRFCIPARISFEVNEYDPNALAISIPTVIDKCGDFHAWEHAGYVPRGLCPHCGATLTGPMLTKDECSACKQIIYKTIDGVRTPINHRLEFNSWVLRQMNTHDVLFSVDTILIDPNNPKFSAGLSIAMKINERKQTNPSTDANADSVEQPRT